MLIHRLFKHEVNKMASMQPHVCPACPKVLFNTLAYTWCVCALFKKLMYTLDCTYTCVVAGWFIGPTCAIHGCKLPTMSSKECSQGQHSSPSTSRSLLLSTARGRWLCGVQKWKHSSVHTGKHWIGSKDTSKSKVLCTFTRTNVVILGLGMCYVLGHATIFWMKRQCLELSAGMTFPLECWTWSMERGIHLYDCEIVHVHIINYVLPYTSIGWHMRTISCLHWWESLFYHPLSTYCMMLGVSFRLTGRYTTVHWLDISVFLLCVSGKLGNVPRSSWQMCCSSASFSCICSQCIMSASIQPKKYWRLWAYRWGECWASLVISRSFCQNDQRNVLR